MIVENVTDFTHGNCKPVVELSLESPDEEGLYNVVPNFFYYVEIGRVFVNEPGWTSRWSL